MWYKRYGKRVFDLCFASVMFVLFLPLMLLIAFVVYLNLGSPIFFRQKRPGFNEKIFVMLKFRTMKEAVDANGLPMSDEQRVTRLGKFLRKYTLDELPELINVIRGEMSLVGPRPLLPEYLPLYSEQERRRHHVLPGITGLAQINGRNLLSWEEKFRHDLTYIDNLNFRQDLQILLQTLIIICQGKGVSAPGCATTRRYTKN